MQHSWDLTPAQAAELQKQLRAQLDLRPLEGPVQTIAGLDISFNFGSNLFFGGIVVMDFPSMHIREKVWSVMEINFPYIPGLLSFREVPVLEKAWQELSITPDLAVLDGHGIAHPRRMGLAAHFGIRVGVPAAGCAKNILTGTYTEPSAEKGSYSHVLDEQGASIGLAFRNKYKVNPVFVSPGHRVTEEDCIYIFRQFPGQYRIPPPTRQAHLWVNTCRKAFYEKE